MEEGRLDIERRVRRMERQLEKKERKERKRNIIIKGMETKGGEERKAIEGILKEIGTRVKIEEINRIGKSDGVEGMWLVKLENLEQKKEVMMKKSMLRGRREKIMDDLT